MAPKYRNSDTDSSNLPNRSHNMLPLNEKVKVQEDVWEKKQKERERERENTVT
jgi:hypothetical protein